jgi:hypothetical protein
MAKTFGTENGPQCRRCSRTSWTYRLVDRFARVMAHCATCQARTELLFPRDAEAPDTVAAVTALHRAEIAAGSGVPREL